jgi:isopentenyl diphosphate isomerase/L-lactate dehydrogenase-like FMN-dependent dehydrogenase
VGDLLDLFEKEMRVAMTLTGAKSVSTLDRTLIVE